MFSRNTLHQYSAILLVLLNLSILACVVGVENLTPGDVIFEDDFDADNSAWRIWYEEEVSAVSVIDDELIMILETPDTNILTTNHSTHPNVEISVTAVKKHGSENNIMGVVCRYLNPKNYYSFLISSDGYFGIAKMQNGTMRVISSENMQYDEVINKGSGRNEVVAVCVQDTLSFSVNGIEVSSVTDGDFSTGANGLIIGSFAAPDDLVVAFDDYRVTAK